MRPWPPSTPIISQALAGAARLRKRPHPAALSLAASGTSTLSLVPSWRMPGATRTGLLEGTGTRLAGQHHAVGHQRLAGVLQRPAGEGVDRQIEGPGEQDLAHLAGRQPCHEAGQDGAVDFRRTPCAALQNLKVGQTCRVHGTLSPMSPGSLSRQRRQVPLRRSRRALPSRASGQRLAVERAMALAPVRLPASPSPPQRPVAGSPS